MQVVQPVFVLLLPLGRGNKTFLGFRAKGWPLEGTVEWEMGIFLSSCAEAIFLGGKHGL